MKIHKNSVAIHLSAEQVYMHRSLVDVRYTRRVRQLIITQPSDQEWADYRKAKDAYDYLLDSPYFELGCSCEHPSVNEPGPKREYVYGETVDEWITRCNELEKEDA